MIRVGLPPEPRKFKPHVTLARFKSNPGSHDCRTTWPTHSLVRARSASQLESFELYSSYPSRQGPHYQVEASYPLGPAAEVTDAN